MSLAADDGTGRGIVLLRHLVALAVRQPISVLRDECAVASPTRPVILLPAMAAKKPAPQLDAAPALDPKDFLAFEKHKWSNPDYNDERLRLRRKLQSIGEPIQAALEAAGEKLTLRVSIHNPYKFNGNRVDSLRFYLSPSDQAKRDLKALLGVEFASDTDASYVHANLVCTVDFEGVKLGLTVHERAWYDTQNVRNLCSNREGAERFVAALNGVQGGYSLQLHDWQKLYPCGSLKWDDAIQFFRYFEPGSHRIGVIRKLAKADPLVTSPGFAVQIASEFQTLLPVYRAILWRPDNNHLGLRRS